MLTRLVEAGVSMCHRYWPEEGSQKHGQFEVSLVSEHVWCEDYLVRTFLLRNVKTGEKRTITQLQFLSWPEKAVPSSAKAILDFRRWVFFPFLVICIFFLKFNQWKWCSVKVWLLFLEWERIDDNEQPEWRKVLLCPFYFLSMALLPYIWYENPLLLWCSPQYTFMLCCSFLGNVCFLDLVSSIFPPPDCYFLMRQHFFSFLSATIWWRHNLPSSLETMVASSRWWRYLMSTADAGSCSFFSIWWWCSILVHEVLIRRAIVADEKECICWFP